MTRLFAFAALTLPTIGCAQQPEASVVRTEMAVVDEPVAPPPGIPVAPMPRAVGKKLPTAPMPHQPGEPDLPCEDIGLDPEIRGNENLPDVTTPGLVNPDDPIGLADPPLPAAKPGPGLPDNKTDKNNTQLQSAFAGRSGAAKTILVTVRGGNAGSERAVALGLAWLAKQQKADGGWEYDGGRKENRAAATGMALLAFLGAGETHKSDGKYKNTVNKGLNFLMKMCPLKGDNVGRVSTLSYEQAIATLALCEAYGMTKDPALKPYTQAAINRIQRSQGPNGSWGYAEKTNGDTSIVGWEVQALQTAKLTKDLVVDDKVIKRVVQFLDSTAAGKRKAMYGYTDNNGASPGTSLTAVGLLCRSYMDGWGPSHPGMIDGVMGLLKNPPSEKGPIKNLYYYYYATQVVHNYDGEDWDNWNLGPKPADGTRKGGMRDWLVGEQVKKEGDNLGSWNTETGFLGNSCGRLGTTAISLLTLEVYYRYLPLYKRGAEGNAVKILEDK